MRNILEQAVIHHLNGDAEKAQELFHQFIVTRARQIHESMRNGESPLNETWDDEEEVTEEYFGEGDLDSLEGDDDTSEGDDLGDDMGGDDFGGETDEGEAADDLGDELGVDAEDTGDLGGEDEDIETRIDDLEAKLEELVAKFDGADDFADDEGDELEAAGDLSDDMADDNGTEEADDAAATDEFGGDDLSDEEDEFKGLGESIASELEKITAKNDHAEVGTGGKVSGNDKSGLPQKNAAARQGGSPVHLKSSTHKGFEREAAPSVGGMKPRRNNVPKADAALSSVAAPSNKKEATEVGASGKKVTPQTKSPVVAAKDVQK